MCPLCTYCINLSNLISHVKICYKSNENYNLEALNYIHFNNLFWVIPKISNNHFNSMKNNEQHVKFMLKLLDILYKIKYDLSFVHWNDTMYTSLPLIYQLLFVTLIDDFRTISLNISQFMFDKIYETNPTVVYDFNDDENVNYFNEFYLTRRHLTLEDGAFSINGDIFSPRF